VNGFLLIDKPSGISSGQCIYFLRSVLNQRKIGHCGTLDPLATGVLPLCLGQATRFSKYVSNQPKTYKVKVFFGLETDSGDITGKEICHEETNVNLNELKEILDLLKGEIYQIPPMFSAIKKEGKPLYYWARKGVYLKRDRRKVVIEKALLEDINDNYATLEVTCSSGTYIRALVDYIGKQLGTYATIIELRRTAIGLIKEESLIQLKSKNKGYYLKNLVECDLVLKNLPKITLNQIQLKKIINGLQVDYNADQEKEGIVRLYEEEGSFVGIGKFDSLNKVSPIRLLAT